VVSGYPNKGKLFKSPQEFGVHLLWLLGGSGNYGDCCCVHCNIPVPGPARPSAVVEEDEKPTITKLPQPDHDATATPPATAPAKPQTTANIRAGAMSSTQAIIPAPVPAASPAPIAIQTPPQATTSQTSTGMPKFPPPSLLYRVGELVWYQTGASWKIGLILQSTPFVPSVPAAHQVLPIGLGMVPPGVARKEDKDLRPFQAFSVPAVHRSELKNRSFDNVDWDGVVGRLHQAAQANASATAQTEIDAALLDASKMAANKIYHSLSLFTKANLAKDGATFYLGAFLGAERVEANDILRVKPPPQFEALNNVFFCLKIIRTQDAQPSVPIFQGILCQLLEGPDPANREAVSPNSIPWGLREEIAWRNSIDPATPRKLISLQTYSCRESDVKGRFYPTSRLGPILAPDRMEQAKKAKNPTIVALPLNDRLAVGTVNPTITPYLGLKKTRVDMAGISIPHGTRFTFEASVKEE
jgi:hypothetical protein